MQSHGPQDALGMMLMMQQMHMQQTFLQSMALQGAEGQPSASHAQVTPLAGKILAREEKYRVRAIRKF
jgi:hypothetical protein